MGGGSNGTLTTGLFEENLGKEFFTEVWSD